VRFIKEWNAPPLLKVTKVKLKTILEKR